MKLATYNIQYGFGRDGRYDLNRSLAVVRDADIIALQEVERGWARSAGDDQPARIAAALPDRFVAYAPVADLDASEVLPDGVVRNARRQFGPMTLSRWPIVSARAEALPKHDTGRAFNLVTGFLETLIAAPGGALRVLNVHLGHASAAERLDQIAALARRLREAAHEGGPWNGDDADAAQWQCERPAPRPLATLLLGDFNAEPGSAEHRALLALTTPEGEALVDAWAADAWAIDAAGTGGYEDGATFYADPAQQVFEDQRIDYAFLPASLARRARARVDGAVIASDHQPLFVEIGEP